MQIRIFGLAAFFALSIGGVSSALAAEGDPIDDFIIEEEEDKTEVSTTSDQILDFLDRNVSLSAGGYQGFGGSTDHALWHGLLGFEYEAALPGRFGKVRVEVTGGYYFRRTALDVERETRNHMCTEEEPCTDGQLPSKMCSVADPCDEGRQQGLPGTPDIECTSGMPCTDGQIINFGTRTEGQTFKSSDKGFELRDAYLSYSPIPELSIDVGRKRPIWGQFKIISPINLLLPIEFQSKDFSYSNAGFRQPQDVVEISWSPTERIETRAYYFIGSNIDPLVKKTIERQTYDIYLEDSDSLEGPSDNERRRTGELGGNDYDGFALRGLYYGNGFTLGLTWHNGHNGGFFFSDLPSVSRGSFDNGSGDFYNVAPRNILPKAQSFAAELSVPVGRWTWNAELIYSQVEQDLPNLSSTRSSDLALAPVLGDRRTAYYDWIIDSNGGRGYVTVDYIFGGIGFDADYGRWDFGVSAIFFIPTFSGKAKDGKDLYEAAYPDEDNEIGINEILPTGYITFDIDEEANHQLGLAGGVLGPIFGVSGFYIGKWRDNFSWLVELGARRLISDTFLVESEETGSNDVDVDLKDDISFEVRMGVVWEF